MERHTLVVIYRISAGLTVGLWVYLTLTPKDPR